MATYAVKVTFTLQKPLHTVFSMQLYPLETFLIFWFIKFSSLLLSLHVCTGASDTEVLARYTGKVVCQARDGCQRHHADLPELPHEKLDAGGSEHLQGCQERSGTWPLVPLASNTLCFTG